MAEAFLLDPVLWHLPIFCTLFYGNHKYSRPCFMAKSPQKDPVSPEHRDHDHMGVPSPGSRHLGKVELGYEAQIELS